MTTWYTVIENAPAYGVSICTARRFTDEEKQHFADWYKDIGFVGMGDHIMLRTLKWSDMPKRNSDGSFLGCDNQAWIITGDEKSYFIQLDAERQAEAEQAKIAEDRAYYEDVVKRASRQPKLYTREEAKRLAKQYNDLYNEGGEGYIPHYYTIDEVEAAKQWLSAH